MTALQANSSVKISKVGTPPDVSLEFSIDNGRAWNQFVVGSSEVVLKKVGDVVCFRAGANGTIGDGQNKAMALNLSNYCRFVTSG